MPVNNYTILWEYDKPLSHDDFRPYTSGIYQWYISPAFGGVKTVVDDRGVTGYYRDNNATVYDIQSLVVDKEIYSKVTSYATLYSTNKSFYYDRSTTLLLVHFTDFEPPFTFTDITLGAVVGYSKGNIGNNKHYFNDIYYEPRVKSVFPINKSKDPLFYGLLKYSTGTITCANEDGFFDDWRSRNLFSQPTRLKLGEYDDSYSSFSTVFTGKIEDDSRSWYDFSVKLQDVRKGLTQPIATNLLTKTTYSTLPDGNVDKPKPIAYGTILNAPCMNLNETAISGNYLFMLCDTEFNAVDSLTKVYLNGKEVAGGSYSVNLATGVLSISSSASVTINGETNTIGDNLDGVTADFVATDFDNGVDIIKDLILNYDNKVYSTDFWDTTDTSASQSIALSTSVYIDDNKKLSEVIEQVCNDIGAIFFSKDDGRYSIRIYTSSRSVTKTIYPDEWLDEPKIENNGSEFLSSVIIKYNHNIASNTYEQYENINYKQTIYDNYRSYKNTTIETNLTSLVDAESRSEIVMNISKQVSDIIERTIPYTTDIEIMDFVECDPVSRMFTKYGVDIIPDNGIYEVLGLKKDLEKFTLGLTLRYVKDPS